MTSVPVVHPASHAPYVAFGGRLGLSNAGQLELLRGAVAQGVPLRTRVHGSSMTPFIRDGDVVVIEPMAGAPPRIGEVVAVALPVGGRMVVHRVVATVGNGWLIRGDSCPGSDAVVDAQAIVGRVGRVERQGRRVHLGLGPQGSWIAALSRSGALTRINAVGRAPRVAASRALTTVQGVPAYRRAARRIAPPVVVSEASPADMTSLWRQMASCQAGPPRAGPDVLRFAARLGGRVAGFADLVHVPEERGAWAGDWLASLAVRARYRGLGVGQALVRRVVAEAEVRGIGELRLAVCEDDRRTIRLCRKLGFEPVVVAALEPVIREGRACDARRRVIMRRR